MRIEAFHRTITFAGGTLFLLFVMSCGVNKAGVEIGSDHDGYGKSHKGGPPPHAPAHGYRAKQAYRYYPAVEVYFDITKRVYFYLEGSNWKVSASLPNHLATRLGDYVSVEMETDRPYTRHELYKKKFPPAQKHKDKKWAKKKKW
jgi:hypothetical protein